MVVGGDLFLCEWWGAPFRSRWSRWPRWVGRLVACRSIPQLLTLQLHSFTSVAFDLEEGVGILSQFGDLLLVHAFQQCRQTTETQSRTKAEQNALQQHQKVDHDQQNEPEPKHQVDELEVAVHQQLAGHSHLLHRFEPSELTVNFAGEKRFAIGEVLQPVNRETGESTAWHRELEPDERENQAEGTCDYVDEGRCLGEAGVLRGRLQMVRTDSIGQFRVLRDLETRPQKAVENRLQSERKLRRREVVRFGRLNRIVGSEFCSNFETQSTKLIKNTWPSVKVTKWWIAVWLRSNLPTEAKWSRASGSLHRSGTRSPHSSFGSGVRACSWFEWTGKERRISLPINGIDGIWMVSTGWCPLNGVYWVASTEWYPLNSIQLKENKFSESHKTYPLGFSPVASSLQSVCDSKTLNAIA